MVNSRTKLLFMFDVLQQKFTELFSNISENCHLCQNRKHFCIGYFVHECEAISRHMENLRYEMFE